MQRLNPNVTELPFHLGGKCLPPKLSYRYLLLYIGRRDYPISYDNRAIFLTLTFNRTSVF